MENTAPDPVEVPDLRDTISKKLLEEERSLSWLRRKLVATGGTAEGLGYNNLYAMIVEKRIGLNQVKLDAINKALGTAYTLTAE